MNKWINKGLHKHTSSHSENDLSKSTQQASPGMQSFCGLERAYEVLNMMSKDEAHGGVTCKSKTKQKVVSRLGGGRVCYFQLLGLEGLWWEGKVPGWNIMKCLKVRWWVLLQQRVQWEARTTRSGRVSFHKTWNISLTSWNFILKSGKPLEGFEEFRTSTRVLL